MCMVCYYITYMLYACGVCNGGKNGHRNIIFDIAIWMYGYGVGLECEMKWRRGKLVGIHSDELKMNGR